MGLYDTFEMSHEAESGGVTLDYGDGFKVKIARAGGSNKNFLKAIEKIGRKYRKQIQLDVLPDDVAKSLFHEVYADTIVLGWDGCKDREGKPLPYSRDNCLKLFQELPDWFADVKEQAQNLALFREVIDENDSKNSAAS